MYWDVTPRKIPAQPGLCRRCGSPTKSLHGSAIESDLLELLEPVSIAGTSLTVVGDELGTSSTVDGQAREGYHDYTVSGQPGSPAREAECSDRVLSLIKSGLAELQSTNRVVGTRLKSWHPHLLQISFHPLDINVKGPWALIYKSRSAMFRLRHDVHPKQLSVLSSFGRHPVNRLRGVSSKCFSSFCLLTDKRIYPLSCTSQQQR